jgi:hypothetical protein
MPQVQLTIAKESSFDFSRKKLFNYCKKPFGENFINNIHYSELNSKAINYILEYIKNYDLIIVYEASETFKTLLNKKGIQYIDIWLSPIRFCKDMMFEFYSNNSEIQKRLEFFQINDKKIKKQAKVIKEQSEHIFNQKVELSDNSALIIGQVFFDKSVMKEDRFLTLIDFKNEIKEYSKEYEKIYFLKHPSMKEKDFSKILNHFKDIKNLIYLNKVNTYYLLSQKEIKAVIGISSSVLKEAKYFGKKVKYFYKEVIPKNYVRVYKKYYKTQFWESLFSIKSKKKFEYLTHDNYLRYRFSPYSYKEVMNDNHELQFYKSSVKIYQKLASLDEKRKYILYGYGSIGKLVLPFLCKHLTIVGIIDIELEKSKKKIDGFKLIRKNEIKEGDNIIITPFLYNTQIEKELQKCQCNIIRIVD